MNSIDRFSTRKLPWYVVFGITLFAVGSITVLPDVVIPDHGDSGGFLVILVKGLVSFFISLFFSLLWRQISELETVNERSLALLEEMTTFGSVSKARTSMLISCSDRFRELLQELLRTSLQYQLNVIADVSPVRYLTWLEAATEDCSSYRTIHHGTLDWFSKETSRNGHLFLQALSRNASLNEKIRLFVVSDDEAESMREMTSNVEKVEEYWQNAGDFESYWTTESQMKTAAGNNSLHIVDVVLCDEELCFRYDEKNKTLRFDLVGTETLRELQSYFEILRLLERQIRFQEGEPFTRIASADELRGETQRRRQPDHESQSSVVSKAR